jgi:hypothetical protein
MHTPEPTPWRCTNDRYCPAGDTFATVGEFLDMCRAAFGAAPELTQTQTHHGLVLHDERGDIVLREVV